MPDPTPVTEIDIPIAERWKCLCGNLHDDDGFVACDLFGDTLDPEDYDTTWALYQCLGCGLLIDAGLRDPVTGALPVMLLHPVPPGARPGVDPSRVHEAVVRRLRAETEDRTVLAGDVVEFGDGVRRRLAVDREGMFATPITLAPSDFQLTDFAAVRYTGSRTEEDIPVDPGELQLTGEHHRVASHYRHHDSDTGVEFDHRARVARTARIAAQATLARIRALDGGEEYSRHIQAQRSLADRRREARTLFAGLDAYLTAGGRLPTSWAAAQPAGTATAREIARERLSTVYAADLHALATVFGFARIELLGDTWYAIEVPVGTCLLDHRLPGEILIRTADPGLVDTREQIRHWEATLYIEEQPIAHGHSLISAADAATAALGHHRRGIALSELTCPCEMASRQDCDPFTDAELHRIRADYRDRIRARREAGIDTESLSAVAEVGEAITLRHGVIVIVVADNREARRTIQFIRRLDRQIMAFDADRRAVIGQWPREILSPELITAACAGLRT